MSGTVLLREQYAESVVERVGVPCAKHFAGKCEKDHRVQFGPARAHYGTKAAVFGGLFSPCQT